MLFIKTYEEFLFEDVWSDKTQKFLENTNSNVSKNIIETYIRDYKEFKQKYLNDKKFVSDIKSQTNVDPLDFIKMSFEDLEKVVDYIKSMKNTKQGVKIDVDGTPVFKEGDLEIYRADNKDACIKYSTGYSWCIGRKDSQNMFNTYRFKEHQPIFYFVKNLKRTNEEFKNFNINQKFNDKYHFFVIQVPYDVNINDKSAKQYVVTSAQNGDDTSMSWLEISKIEPLLIDIQSKFEGSGLSEIEKSIYDRFSNGILDENFKKLTYEEKNSYLDVVLPNIELRDKQFLLLPDDLKNKFIGLGLGLSINMLEYVRQKADLYKYLKKTMKMLYENLTTEENSCNSRQYISMCEVLPLEYMKNMNIWSYDSELPIDDILQFIENKYNIKNTPIMYNFICDADIYDLGNYDEYDEENYMGWKSNTLLNFFNNLSLDDKMKIMDTHLDKIILWLEYGVETEKFIEYKQLYDELYAKFMTTEQKKKYEEILNLIEDNEDEDEDDNEPF